MLSISITFLNRLLFQIKCALQTVCQTTFCRGLSVVDRGGGTVTDSDQPAQDPADPDLATALYKLSFVESIPSTVTQKAMIWTEKEAIRKQVMMVSLCSIH